MRAPPYRVTGRRLTGAVAGSLIAGLGLTALLIAMERNSGKPSEVIVLGRRSLEKLGIDTPPDDRLPDPMEQIAMQSGHLLLSAAAGAAYSASTDGTATVVGSGIKFGLVFYATLQWIAGPLLGVKRPEWESDAGTIGMHAFNHVVFGLITAAGAAWAGRRPRTSSWT